ncbi:kinesin-like protein KIF22 [Acipenser ruthenus]|uniref:kinesin-like protein KIF22 n=1 Tax=Acipenser ruthenus TaxID=7906 RepID=UPI00145AC5C3|nr:kinesin-like protein KIF22 [Acipenser ruthenus]XP_058868231.1 kinesin-like protein KIF22 [Acipenser ruthenus]
MAAMRVSLAEAGLVKKPSHSAATRVRVSVRLRPYMSRDDEGKEGLCVRGTGNQSLEILNWRNTMETMSYQFDAFYGENSSQQEVYTGSVKPVLSHLLTGQNTSVFAYGPTGAGKTHTMLGGAEEPGVIPRAVRDVFQMVREESGLPASQDWEHSVSMSYLEIYNEKVLDLLEPQDQDLPIREDKDKNILIPGLTQRTIGSFSEFESHFLPASQNRTMASTKLNTRSSRSHTVLLIRVVKSQRVLPFRQLTGKLYLIDLAGSEDNRRTGNQGIRLKESGAINSSLFVLSKVVDSLNQGLARVPYRDSKLTRLLQDSLGGSAHSVMITNIAPEQKYYFDTLTALNFAAKSKQVINKPFTRETLQTAALKRPREEAAPNGNALKKIAKESRDSSAEISDVSPTACSPPVAMFDPSVMVRLLTLEKMMKGTPEKERLNLLRTVQESRQEIKELQLKQKELEEQALAAQSLLAETRKAAAAAPSIPLHRKTSTAKPLRQRAIVASQQVCPVQPLSSSIMTCKAEKRKMKVSESDVPENEESLETRLDSAVLQRSRDRILNLLNTGSLKELKGLQKIGDKKAKLIIGWREINGAFTQVEDLGNIEGISAKLLTSFLKVNILSAITH